MNSKIVLPILACVLGCSRIDITESNIIETGSRGGLYKYHQTLTLPASSSGAAEILTKPLTECAVRSLITGCDYIAENTGTGECTCVGGGESLPQGTWKLFYGKVNKI